MLLLTMSLLSLEDYKRKVKRSVVISRPQLATGPCLHGHHPGINGERPEFRSLISL